MASKTILILTEDSEGNPKLTIDHKSDPSALPHEHEEEHGEIVKKVSNGGKGKVSRAPVQPVEISPQENSPEKEAVRS